MRGETYRVGDLVRIRDWDDMVGEFGIDSSSGTIPCREDFVRSMRVLCGSEFLITEIRGTGIVEGLGCGWTIHTDMIRHVVCDIPLPRPIDEIL